jgi:hypothetical protein
MSRPEPFTVQQMEQPALSPIAGSWVVTLRRTGVGSCLRQEAPNPRRDRNGQMGLPGTTREYDERPYSRAFVEPTRKG